MHQAAMPHFDPESDTITGSFVVGAIEEEILNSANIQGNILPGFNAQHLVLLGYKFDPGRLEPARKALQRVFADIATSTLQQVNDVRNQRRHALRAGAGRPPTSPWINVAFSFAALRLLASDADKILDTSFKKGMWADSRALGDPSAKGSEGHPAQWVVGGTADRTPDVLFLLASDDKTDLDGKVQVVQENVEDGGRSGLVVVHYQAGDILMEDPARNLPANREHFGFRDGVSQVGVRGRLSEASLHFLTRRYIDPADAERAKRFGKPGQPLVWPGQFVFGYNKQRTDDPITPGPPAFGGLDWMNDGSYLVYRRLRQDVARFRAFLVDEAVRLQQAGLQQMTAERLGALLIGRWPSGAPLMLRPSGDDVTLAQDPMAVNHFGYAENGRQIEVITESGQRAVEGWERDDQGLRCPRFAHIRKVNPRDIPGTDLGGQNTTLTLQILRRGITWGPSLVESNGVVDAANGQRGLLFLSYQTSIVDQFKKLIMKWSNEVHGPQPGGHDLLIGQNNDTRNPGRYGELLIGTESFCVETPDDWVMPTGGGYFFAPSISALRWLLTGQ